MTPQDRLSVEELDELERAVAIDGGNPWPEWQRLIDFARAHLSSGWRPINILFDGPPSHESGRFVEVEDDDGKSLNVGEWIERPDGLWALRIVALPPPPSSMENDDDMVVRDPSPVLYSAAGNDTGSISGRYDGVAPSQPVGEEGVVDIGGTKVRTVPQNYAYQTAPSPQSNAGEPTPCDGRFTKQFGPWCFAHNKPAYSCGGILRCNPDSPTPSPQGNCAHNGAKLNRYEDSTWRCELCGAVIEQLSDNSWRAVSPQGDAGEKCTCYIRPTDGFLIWQTTCPVHADKDGNPKPDPNIARVKERLAEALIVLAEANIPTDIQGLLVHGDPARGIAPNALEKALAPVLRVIEQMEGATRRQDASELGQREVSNPPSPDLAGVKERARTELILWPKPEKGEHSHKELVEDLLRVIEQMEQEIAWREAERKEMLAELDACAEVAVW